MCKLHDITKTDIRQHLVRFKLAFIKEMVSVGASFFNDDDIGGGYEPVYNGSHTSAVKQRRESKGTMDGRMIFSGVDITEKKRDELPVYALLLGILSIFCIFFENGYFVSLLGLLIDAYALNKGTKRRKVAMAAAICCATAVVLFIVFVSAKPLLQEVGWYIDLTEKIERTFFW